MAALAAATAATILLPLTAAADVAHLLPKVKMLTATDSSLPFTTVAITDPQKSTSLTHYLTECGATVATADGAAGEATPVVVKYVDRIPGAFRHNFAAYPDEEYALSVTPQGVTITAVGPTAVTRAAQTLAQLAIDRPDNTLPCVEITDWPAFKVRGYMHDVGRSFIEFETLKRHVDLLAHFKINTFHWHLTENQAWRFEVDGYPQLTSAESMTRCPGKFYTRAQCSELARYAAERGVTVIPEIDMPGHSDAFTRAMGFSMQTDSGIEVLKEALRQLAETFPDAPYIHIGADEVALTYPGFLDIMSQYVRNNLGRKVVVWNPIRGITINPGSGFDLTTTWHPTGRAVKRLPNIDTRYNYANLMDLFADPAALYLSNVYYEPQGTEDVVGAITAIWNDRRMATEEDIVRQNGFFTMALVTAERAWAGGQTHYFEENVLLPLSGPEYDAFADFENRFLLHKDGILRDEPVPYVRQTNVRWRITEPMPRANGSNVDEVFPPETSEPALSYTHKGRTYGTRRAVGAAVYLTHSWESSGYRVNALFNKKPGDNVTSYAYTYVYSPEERTVGAFIEFQTYGRSEVYPAPLQGKWDRKGSDVWVNDERIAPPAWTGKDTPGTITNEDLLGNQNFTAREPSCIHLKKGWNKVLLKLPYCNLPNIRLNQWMFTFVLTDLEGRNALDDVIYSPDRLTDEGDEQVMAAIEENEAWMAATFSDLPGYYAPSLADDLRKAVDALKDYLDGGSDGHSRSTLIENASKARAGAEAEVAKASINQPAELCSDGTAMVYYLSTPNRDGRFITGNGANTPATGNTAATAASGWLFKKRADGAWDIVNYADGTFLSPASAFNTAIFTRTGRPDAGWTVGPASVLGFVTVASGNVQLNQTRSPQNFQVYNWSTVGSGNDTTDTGCQIAFSLASDLMAASVAIPTVDPDGTASGAVFDLAGRRYPAGTTLVPGTYLSQGRKFIVH